MQNETSTTAPGAIWYTSWGYDQTNVEFFQVVRETPASVTLRRITANVQDGRVFPQPDHFNTDCHLMGNHGTETYTRDMMRGYSEKVCRKGRYGSVKIDNVRRAYPYEGGGKYDTYAAGQPGH